MLLQSIKHSVKEKCELILIFGNYEKLGHFSLILIN